MATHKIGKLKFNLSKEGFAYRMGDGEIHRIYFGKKAEPAPEDEGYDAAAPEDDSDYAYDDQYDERGADDYYDDEYDDADDYDGGADYDEEYDDGYPEDGDAPDEYSDEEEYAPGGVSEYIENNIWVIIALLIVLPPLGIYLLWKLGKFEFPTRVGASAASAIWFIVILILIIRAIFFGGSDVQTPGEIQLSTVTPPPTIRITAEPTETIPGLSAEPTETAIATPKPDNTGITGGATGGNEVPVDGSSIVYSPSTGAYYHANGTCANIGGASVTPVTLQTALNRNQAACPLCYTQTIYYARPDSTWYHTDQYCQDMKNAVVVTKQSAEANGQTACPVCAGGTAAPTADTSKLTPAQRFANTITNDKSGMKVWMTKNGKNYHLTSDCRGMSGARQVTLLAAIQDGKTSCSTCCAYLDNMVYCTQRGKSYHTDEHCQNMQNASHVTLAAALIMGKSRCDICITDDVYTKKESPVEGGGSSGGVYVYATPDGRWYHTNSTCSNMKNAARVTLAAMISAGRPACPVCASTADDTVYASVGGKYYHSYATCSDMTNAKSGTLARALAYGYTRCPRCWSGGSTPSATPAPGATPAPTTKPGGTVNYSGVYVYGTQTGDYYHTSKSCSRCPSDATRGPLEEATRYGLKNCPECAKEAKDKVYAVAGGTRFHKNKNCSNMVNPVSGTMESALMYGLTACNICYSSGGNANNLVNSHTYTSGKSGISVYATVEGAYYHARTSCWRVSGSPAKITLETALNYGKTACPSCASSANKTVYATKGGKYYHYTQGCAGINSSKGSLDSAMAYGFAACPNCVTGSMKSSNVYKVGTSKISVYGSISNKYFHANSSCSGMKEVSYISLETALNYGKVACPVCASSASRVVYAKAGSDTYHANASCAGSGSTGGTWAQALALGMKPCTICVTGEAGHQDYGDGENYSADGSTSMYIDINGNTSANTYHGYSDCEDSGMKNGTRVTLQFALEQGYKPCGYCDPPSSIR